jgi:hypothetical protein
LADADRSGWWLLVRAGGAAAVGVTLLGVGATRWQLPPRLLAAFRRLWRKPWAGAVILAVPALAATVAQRSAIALELGLLAALAWYTSTQWDFVSGDGTFQESAENPESRIANMTGGLLIGSICLFLWVGSTLPTSASVLVACAGIVLFLVTGWRILCGPFPSLKRLLWAWFLVTVFGAVVCGFVLDDPGSMAAWFPALLCGLLLWTVRPEEPRNTPDEHRRSRLYRWLAVSAGLTLLGILDSASLLVSSTSMDNLARPRQRVVLAQDVSYLSAGEWITQVRWLASQQEEVVSWVANLNSDVALFGVASVFGKAVAVLASLGLIGVALALAWTSDQLLRQGWLAEQADHPGTLLPVQLRAVGLFLGMLSILLLAQWLVHLTTGVDLRYPITGLVLPWISHGNTSHLLLTAATALPLATALALEEAILRPRRRRS